MEAGLLQRLPSFGLSFTALHASLKRLNQKKEVMGS
jgi:hypothetical protein